MHSIVIRKTTFFLLDSIYKNKNKKIKDITLNYCYSYNYRILIKLREMGLLEKNEYWVLTEKGQEVYKNLKIIFNNTKMDYNNIYELTEMKGGLK